MAYPKKKNGWRKIVVDGQIYRWRFIEDYYLKCGARFTIQATASDGQQLDIALANHFSWISFSDVESRATKNKFPVTPKLAAEAIRFGLANGWKPSQRAFPMRAVYEEGSFRVVKNF